MKVSMKQFEVDQEYVAVRQGSFQCSILCQNTVSHILQIT